MSKTRVADTPLPLPEEEVLTRLEACRLARISVSTFDRAVADKSLTILPKGRGRKIRVTRQEVLRYMGVTSDAA